MLHDRRDLGKFDHLHHWMVGAVILWKPQWLSESVRRERLGTGITSITRVASNIREQMQMRISQSGLFRRKLIERLTTE